jgi:hypothetical protein
VIDVVMDQLPLGYSDRFFDRVQLLREVKAGPDWRHGLQFSPPRGLMLRHDVSAKELGIIPLVTVSPDEVRASVSEDTEVIAAVQRSDRATPSTWRDLVRARLAAQARALRYFKPSQK